MGVRVGVAIKMRHLPAVDRVGVENFFLGQSIGIDETNTFLLNFFSSMNIVGATGFAGLWALGLAW